MNSRWRKHLLVCMVLLVAPMNMSAETPTIVVLPPRLPAAASEDLRAEALQLCDDIAAGLSDTGKVNIVDRSELDRIIAEWKLAGGKNRPALSYDAMLRLEVTSDAENLLPSASLMLVDLSTGNLLGSWKFDWPTESKTIKAILPKIPSCMEHHSDTDGQRLRLRIAGVAPTQLRMAPIGLRMEKLFVEALGKSDKITLMQHLEAGTSQEEALLLFMGFTRMGEGRQFAPQADATLELRIAETEAIGTAFQDTPIEVAFRMCRADAADEQWTSFSGKVSDCDLLARKAWETLAKQLDKADAGAGLKLLDDLEARRKQALIELEAANRVRNDNMDEVELARAKLEHVNTALKLDPLCEEAAFRRVCLLQNIYGYAFTKYDGTKDVYELLLAAARYNEMFPQNPDRTSGVQDCGWLAVRMTPLLKMYKGDEVPIDRDLRRLLDAMKCMVEISTSGDPRRLSRGCPRFLLIVCRGMRLSGMSVEQREAWLDGIMAGVSLQLTQIDNVPQLARGNFLFHHHWIYAIAAEMAAEEGRVERAQGLVQKVQQRLDSKEASTLRPGQGDDLVKMLRRAVVKMNKPDALTQFDKWVSAKHTPVRPIWFGNLPGSRYCVYESDKNKMIFKPTIAYVPNPQRFPWSLAPLCEGDGFMYLMTRKSGGDFSWGEMDGMGDQGIGTVIVRIPLDNAGRPKGKSVPTKQRSVEAWDSIELLPQPEVHKHLHVLSVKFIDGRLYIGTMYSGLLIFDPKEKSWTVVDPAAGLPCRGVYAMLDRGDGTILCTGHNTPEIGGDGDASFCFSYSIKDGQIRLLKKDDYAKRQYLFRDARQLWEHDGHLMALSTYDMMENLLDEKPVRRKPPTVPTPGWGDRNYTNNQFLARVGDRLFVTVGGGILELDTSGAVKDSIFMGGIGVLPGTIDHGLLTRVEVPNPTPAEGPIVSDGQYIWFTGNCVLYDPQKKFWYGPLAPAYRYGYSIATKAGLWLGSNSGIFFIDRDKFMADAKAADRVVTTEQYVERRDKAIAEQMAPVSRARIMLAMRQFEQAADLLQTHLQEKPDDPHAVLLLGMVYDCWGGDKLTQAEECYARLEQFDDPQVRFTGMYMRLHMLVRVQRWEDAAKLMAALRETFPAIFDEYGTIVSRLEQQIKQHVPDSNK